jgi:2-methylcitrate dehydratase PrpD
MTAYVAGLELGVRVALAVLPQHRDNGWHPTATIGLFCALGAAARLMNLSAEQTARAIGIAVSEAAGVSANFGTMTKPFHAGRAARSAVLAAQLAANGFSGNPGAFEHPAGFFNVFVRGGEPNVEAMLSDFGSPLELANIGVALKPYPCCGLTHSAADLMLALRREHNLSPDQVKQIEIFLHPKSIGGVDRPAPATGLDAAFSTQYVVARALTDGVLRIDQFQDAATREPRIREVLTKITLRPNSHIDPKVAHIFSSELVIHTIDGKRIARYADEPNYRDLDNPLNDAELWEKFSDCARRGIPAEDVKSLFDLLMRLEAQPSLQAISDKLAIGHSRSAVAAE